MMSNNKKTIEDFIQDISTEEYLITGDWLPDTNGEYFAELVAFEYGAYISFEFYDWMQQYQDISCALRINECENTSELFKKFLEQ